MRAPTGGAIDLSVVHRGGDTRTRPRVSEATLPYARARHFARILERRGVRTLYQPLVDLETGEVLGYEALSRGPAGSPLERPDLLFEAARDLGLVAELDWVCRATAMGGAMAAALSGSLTLFVNVEPDVPLTSVPDDVLLTLKRAERQLRVVLEVTERALLERPSALLQELAFARERWWGVALDDVGANPDSLALMPLVNPDVIKMDFHYVRRDWDASDRRVLDAVRRQAATTGAAILAEGIETEEHLERARAMGATIGQGWLFGRPEPLPAVLPRPARVIPLLDIPTAPAQASPYELVEQLSEPQTVTEATARRMAAAVEQNAMMSPEAPLVLAAFPEGQGPWGTPSSRLGRLIPRSAFVGAVGPQVVAESGRGFQCAPIAADDVMADEWIIAVLAAHHAEVLVAYDAGDRDADGHRLLDVVTTTDRDAVARVCELLMRRLGTSGPAPLHVPARR